MPSSLSTYDELRAARVRVVGTRFLQLRPWIAGAGAAANAALLASSGAPREQLVAVGAATGVLVLAFALEAAWLVRHPLSERWLLSTLVGTALCLGVGCALTGGARSPLLPLVLAPVVIAYAAFARGRAARWVAASGVAVVALLALDPAAGRMPPIAPSHAGWMALVSTTVALVLSRVGVAGLSEAQLGAGETVARMREALLADAAARARDADVVGARVAHEVRNPLTSIKGLVQLLERRARDGELGDARDARRLEVVLEEVQRVESILDDYLQFARPLAALEPREVSLRALLDDVATLLEIEAMRASVVLWVEGGEVRIDADPRRLREALLNLAKNALAAMPKGGALTLRVARDADGARLEVQDTGVGMDDATLAKVGTPYFTTRDEGTGLGVTLARSAARQHGGELRYESTPGRGTTAIVTLPTTPPRVEEET